MDFKIDRSFDSILIESEFHYSKAQNLWKQWKEYQLSNSDIEKLKSLSYEEFCNSSDVMTTNVRELLFKLIAYVDTHARDKNILNEYDDKRSIARSNIRQNDWVSQFLKYKLDPEGISSGVSNLVKYLEDPTSYWPIISEEHKKWIYEYFVESPYKPSLFNTRMEECLGRFWNGVNPMNKTCFLTRSLYSMDYAWKMDKNKTRFDRVVGLFVHETDDGWKEWLLNEMSSGKKGCIWWHTKPKRYTDDIINQLEDKIRQGETFEFYYIKDNQAYFKAIVSDFADKDNYDQKKLIWQNNSPAWLEDAFEDFCDDKRNAEIVFLIDKFEKLYEPIPLNCFQIYKEMPYNKRGGIAAFSSIISIEELEILSKMEKYKKSLLINRNMVLTGAPGTGKTYLAQQIANSLGAEKAMVQFHPSYDYTDFVEGLRPINKEDSNNIGFELRNGIFKEFCAKALSNYQDAIDNGSEPTPFVFIIDEINRGDIAKIFGELFFAIDPNYRGCNNKIATQYQNLVRRDDPFADGFFVPENVYIIGTMNDIDRGVETIDFAFRRRFIWPKVKAQDTIGMLSSLGEFAKEASDRMTKLNTAIANVESLNEDYQIGGSYFLKINQFKDEENPFDMLWEYCIEPLLIEYLRGSDDIDDTIQSLKLAFDNAE